MKKKKTIKNKPASKKTPTKKKLQKKVTSKKKKVQKKVTPKKKQREVKSSVTGIPEREKAIKHIKTILLKQKEILLGEAGSTINNLPDVQTLFPDLGDQASMEIDRNFLLRLRGREQKLLKKIEEALEKIESGNFGYCEMCGREIDIRRLIARPVTTMCIECKTEQEEEERLREL